MLLGRPRRSWRQGVLDYRDSSGRRQRRVLGSDRRIAERLKQEIIGQRDLERAGLASVEGQNRSLAELRDLYLADLATRATEKHLGNVTARLDRVLRAVHVARVRDLQPFAVMQHRSSRLKAGLSHRTANGEAGVLSAMLTWAMRAQLIAENPLRSLQPLPESDATKRCVRRAMTDDEISRFLAAAEADDDLQGERMAAIKPEFGIQARRYGLPLRRPRVPQAVMWQTFLETGARYGELAALAWADVNWSGPTLVLRAENTKSRKARHIPLRAALAERLGQLLGLHERVLGRKPRASDKVFLTPDGVSMCEPTNNLRRVFLRLLRRTRIPQVTPEGHLDIHALRHTAASRWARAGVALVQAQRLLGHSDPKLTARVYTHLQVEDLRAAVESIRAGPRPTPLLVAGDEPSPAMRDYGFSA